MLTKKSFEESIDDEVCNFNSDISEVGNNESQKKQMSTSIERKLASKPIHKRNHSRNSRNSRNSTKESPRNLSISIIQQNGNNLVDLVESLKNKLSVYESEMRSLIDEKIQMQITINNLQMNTLKKSSRSDCSGSSSNRKASNTDLPAINKELKILGDNINRQKKLLETNDTSLDETLGNIELNDYYNVILNDIEND